jgi:tetratricopeptide (TPR) repeat protein
LRHTGHSREALQLLATAAHKIDPLDVRSMAERWLASKDPAAAKTLTSTMLDHPQTFQETAAEYLNAGLWKDGTDVLLQMVSSVPEKAKVHPMAYYYLGYFAEKLGQRPLASEYYRLALSMPPDYVFPFQA